MIYPLKVQKGFPSGPSPDRASLAERNDAPPAGSLFSCGIHDQTRIIQTMSKSLPPFSDLPIQRPGPTLNAWGLYGAEDELGRLNLISPETRLKGVKAVEHGLAINLK